MNIEVCCGSFSDAYNAFLGGAKRVELCSSLFFGGLTPTFGTFSLVKEKTDLEIAVMIRPRQGGFAYSDQEFEVMKKDADFFINSGADALVFGFLTPSGHIDFDKTKEMVNFIGGRCQCVFHRAFDVALGDMMENGHALSKCGINRILTSGGAKTALLGIDNIKKLMEIPNIDILPGGSVRAHNIDEIFAQTHCNYVHTSAFEAKFDLTPTNNNVSFVGLNIPKEGEYALSNMEIIREIVEKGRELL